MAQKQTVKKEKNPAAVALGRLGGLKGGPTVMKMRSPEERKRIASIAEKAGALRLTSQERSEIARRAARARWSKKPKQRHGTNVAMK